jgi:penicillin-binding protein 1B
MQNEYQIRSRRSKLPPRGWKKTRRVASIKAPPPSPFRRIIGWFFNAWTLSIAGILLVTGFLTLTYFWFEFSDRIDRRLLSGEVFTPTAGIYSAPKTLRHGEARTLQQMIEYLRSAGYIEKNNKADLSRSRYWIDGNKLIIEPGVTAVVDGKKMYPDLAVGFSKDGESVASITDLGISAEVKKALLEPKVLSTIAAEGDGRRKTVNFADIPPHLIKAITVTEDRAFFDHYGVNFRGIARALWRRYDGEAEDTPLANQGGSSITQQLVKNLLLTNEPTLERKVTEAYMSLILETRLTKEEIFTLYANQVYLGQQTGVAIYGVGEASAAYFDKDVSQLELHEAAFLAGILRSPNRYNPYKNTERVQERRNQVLMSMLEAGEISEAQYLSARNRPLHLEPPSLGRDQQGMPYFAQHVIDELPKMVSDPEALQHLRVYTSIDPDLQRVAYDTVAKRLDRLEKTYFKKKEPGNLNAALVAIRPKTGEIVAMVGGRNYEQNQFNRATSAMRQPGSVFKPFVYAQAINSAYEPAARVFTAASVIKDERKVFAFDQNTYAPNNYGDSFSNAEITLRDALVRSKNTITVDIAMQVNIGRVMNLAAKAGLPKVEKAYPSMALGTAEATPLQVATGYTAFANLGDRVLPTPITRITAGDGTTKVAPEPDKKQVLRPDVAFILNDIMKDVINRGTAAGAKAWGFTNTEGRAFAGKTGTSRDGWFVGFTPELVTVVYVGFDNNDDLRMTGSESAMPIWAEFMKAALDMYPEWNGDWPMPAGIRKAEIDTRYGTLVRELDGVEPVEEEPVEPQGASADRSIEDDPAWATIDTSPPKQIFVTDVPAEFRRVEYFVGGTVPIPRLIEDPAYDPDAEAEPSPTPMTETWEESAQRPEVPSPEQRSSRAAERSTRSPVILNTGVSVSVCIITGLRATINCPERDQRTFKEGSEPKDFCPLHR